MDSNFQNDNIEVLDVENNESLQPINNVSINMGDKKVNSTINPNAYHPSLNNNLSHVQNNSQTINQTETNAVNNSAPSLVNKFEDDSNYEEVKDNKIMYLILAIAYAILTVGFYGLVSSILIIGLISFIFIGPSRGFASIIESFLQIWWLILIFFVPRLLIKYEMKKYNIDLKEVLSKLGFLSILINIVYSLFNRRR